MELNEIVRKIVDDKISDIHTCLPAKIESYNPETMIADVVLLNQKELEGKMEEIPPIIECPVAHFHAGPFIMRPPYKKGDPVTVVFSEKSLEKLLITGDSEDPQLKRKFSYDDAIVIQGLKVEQEENYPSEESDSLYICNLDKNVKMYLNPDGTLRIANDNTNVMTQVLLGKGTESDGYVKISKKIPGETDIEFVIQNNGVCRISDNSNGTELKFDLADEIGQGAGTAIFTLASQLLLGSSSADDPLVPLSQLQTFISEVQGHSHPSNGSSPSQTFSTDLGSEKVFVDG